MRKNNDGGYVVVTVALLSVVLMGFVALGVDMALLYDSRTTAQQAADAAALAGAFTFVTNPSPGSPQPATATSRATSVATNYTIMGRAITPGNVAVTPDVANQRLKVVITYNESTHFARVLGINTAAIGVTANAEAALGASGAKCVKPWFMPNTIVGASDACAACAAGQKLINGGQKTAYAQNLINSASPFVIKPGNPKRAFGPGQFYEVDFSGGGGAQYRENIASCASPAAVPCNTTFPLLSGNKVGPTKQGTEDLIGNPPNDTYIGPGQYRLANGTISNTSQALVSVAIFDTCSGLSCPSSKFTAAGAPVVGFALVFIERVRNPQATVDARLINVTGCSGSLAGSTEASAFGWPIRLIQPYN